MRLSPMFTGPLFEETPKMTVKDLKEMLDGVPDDTDVLIAYHDSDVGAMDSLAGHVSYDAKNKELIIEEEV